MTHRVFISYSSKDKPQAEAVYAALDAAGIACWMDRRGLAAGDHWPSELADAIKNCEVVVLIFSKNANDSWPVANEIARACDQKKPIITIRIEDARATGDFEFFLARVHWLDAFVGSIDTHLDAIVDAVQNPNTTSRNLTSTLIDDESLNFAIRDINACVSDLKRQDESLRCSMIDNVFELALDYVKRLQDTENWAVCARICQDAAQGVLDVLDATPSIKSDSWPMEIERLQSALRRELARIAENSLDCESALSGLRILFVDFIDRSISEQDPTLHWWATLGLCAFLPLSICSLFFAYRNATTTWMVHYEYAFGAGYGPIGGYLEFSRSLLLLTGAIYLFNGLFRGEFERLLLDWSWRSWRRPGVTIARAFGILLALHTTWAVTTHVLNYAPSHESAWAKRYVESLDLPENANKLEPLGDRKEQIRQELIVESSLGRDYHSRPYRYYLPYCLVNYSVYSAMLITLCVFGVIVDRRRLLEERKGLEKSLANHRIKDSDIDREFERFFVVCFRHTQRYITLLMWIAMLITYESLVTRPTLSEMGWRNELMLSSVVGLTTLIWVGIIMHFYEGAFQRCCNEKSRRHGLNEKWSHRWNTTQFFSKCFLTLRSIVAVAIYVIPILLIAYDILHR